MAVPSCFKNRPGSEIDYFHFQLRGSNFLNYTAEVESQSWALAVFLVFFLKKVAISFKPIPCNLFLFLILLKKPTPQSN